MKIADVLAPFDINPNKDIDIKGITNDSRAVKPGYLFIAYPGELSDGRKYIDQAVYNGASAIIYEPEHLPSGISLPPAVNAIPFQGIKGHLASLGRIFYGHPSKSLHITGITGTNGKTTIAHLLAQAYQLSHHSAAYIGTLGQGQIHELNPLNNTTPDGLCLQHLLNDFVASGIQKIAMEVSSHALSLGRVNGVDFDVAVYSNLTHEHLDFHRTMDEYAKAKANLFQLPELKAGIFNKDDSYAQYMMKQMSQNSKRLTYSLTDDADVSMGACEITMTGSHFELLSPVGRYEIHTGLLGRFNLYNLLAVFCCLMEDKGIPANQLADLLNRLQSVPGRMEVVSKEPCVIVDYAHSPDALKNVLETLSQLKEAKIITVFGCGGERDKQKRPIMGQVAGRYSDVVIVTSDNPRRENPEQIILEVTSGIGDSTQLIKMTERKNAIEYAISLAEKDDIILIAGKGHEEYQQIGAEKIQFSDQSVVRDILSSIQ